MAAETAAVERADRKVRLGRVTSNKMQKTIVVQVVRSIRHPQYGRVMDQVNSFKVHDEENRAKIGDWVKIMETRPLSKDKRWRLVEIVKAASTAPAVPDAEQPSKAIKTVKRSIAAKPDHGKTIEGGAE